MERIEPQLIEPETEFKIKSTLLRIFTEQRSYYLFIWRMFLYIASGSLFVVFIYVCKYFKEQRDLEKTKTTDVYMHPSVLQPEPYQPEGWVYSDSKREIGMASHFGMGRMSVG